MSLQRAEIGKNKAGAALSETSVLAELQSLKVIFRLNSRTNYALDYWEKPTGDGAERPELTLFNFILEHRPAPPVVWQGPFQALVG
ncbi:MAG: hypothetical protein IH914_03985 [candidate division Zixibacteria bacterium]|nr:hypothetical protein [candidate division Zixibacteria bacterium]